MKDFVITPYQYSSGTVPDRNYLLFDFPIGLVVSIGDHDVPGTIFDYFNPLLFGPQTHSFIRFYQPLRESFDCFNLIVKSDYNRLMKTNIFYPPRYIINYSKGTCEQGESMGRLQALNQLVQNTEAPVILDMNFMSPLLQSMFWQMEPPDEDEMETSDQ